MTQAVPTEGFSVPGAGANVPPPNMAPGYVPPAVTPLTKPAEPAQPAAPAAGPAPTADLGAAIAALTAALGTPATAPTNAPAAQASAQGTDDLNSYDVNTIEDPIIRSMATVLQTSGKGVDMNRALGLAIERGDAELVDVAYLREAGGANAEQLVVIAKGIVDAIEAKASEVTSRVHALAGGADAWNASTASFNTAAPAELKLVVKQMLDSNQSNLIEAGAKIVVQFGKSSGLLPNPKPSVQGGPAGMPAAMALDKFEFQAELNKLDSTDRQFPQKRAELFARRQLGKNLGK